MLIGGFQSFSLTDYPEETCAIIFTQGCNFRCPYCHNSELLQEHRKAPHLPLSVSDILRFLNTRRRQLGAVVITGGEPTVQGNELTALCKDLRLLGYKIKLDTNGSNPDILDALISTQLIDFIAMDIKAPWYKYHKITDTPVDVSQLRRSVDIISNSSSEYLFRTTKVEPFLTEQDYTEILSYIPDISKHVFQKFRPEHAWNINKLQRSEE